MSNRSAVFGERGALGGVKQNIKVMMSALLKRRREKYIAVQWVGVVYCDKQPRFVTRRTKNSV